MKNTRTLNLTFFAPSFLALAFLLGLSPLGLSQVSADKIFTPPLNLFVDKSQNTLTVSSGQKVLKTYIVSTGINNSTPVGVFKIVNKVKNPTWYKPGGPVIPPNDPRNLLGTRWMGFDLKSYGIHGTTEPQKLGQQASHGCVRMKNEDVEELYNLIPLKTKVTVVD